MSQEYRFGNIERTYNVFTNISVRQRVVGFTFSAGDAQTHGRLGRIINPLFVLLEENRWIYAGEQ